LGRGSGIRFSETPAEVFVLFRRVLRRLWVEVFDEVVAVVLGDELGGMSSGRFIRGRVSYAFTWPTMMRRDMAGRFVVAVGVAGDLVFDDSIGV